MTTRDVESVLELALSALNRACELSRLVNRDRLVGQAIRAVQRELRQDAEGL